MPSWIVASGVAIVLLIVNGLVGLGVEGSERTKIPGMFAAGWLMLIEGIGFLLVWWLDSFAYGVPLGVGFIVIGFAIVSLPIVHREFERTSVDR